MKISESCVVGLTWVMKDSLGDVLDELDEPVEFLIGGRDLLAAVEQGLIGKDFAKNPKTHNNEKRTLPHRRRQKSFCHLRIDQLAVFPVGPVQRND
jgi:hypothetical protein